MGSPYIRAIIRKYFMDNPGIHIWLNDIKEVLVGQGKRPSTGGIQGAVSQLVDLEMPIEVVERGQCWIYRPNVTKSSLSYPVAAENPEPLRQEPERQEPRSVTTKNKLFELIHTTKQGAMILEDEDGETIIVRPIDI